MVCHFRFEKGPLMIIQICDVKKSINGYLYMQKKENWINHSAM